MGLGQACRREAGRRPACKGRYLGLKPLEATTLANNVHHIHTWSNCHHLTRQCNGVYEWGELQRSTGGAGAKSII